MTETLCEPAALLTQAAIRLKAQHHFLSAYTAARRAAAIQPGHVAPEGAIGAILWNMSRFEEGAEVLRGCVEKVPDSAEYWTHLALCLASLQRDEEAEAAYDRAVECDPKDPAIRWNRSQFRLAKGDWENGFQDYEARIEYRGRPAYPPFPFPTWDGEHLNGKTLIIQGEQGVGDTILSARFIPLLKQRWPDAKLIWYIQPRLHDLFWEYRDYAEFYPPGYPWPKADYGVFQMSLLRILEARQDTLPADPGLIRKRALLTGGKVRVPAPVIESLKVGLAWTGNPEMMANGVRSIPLEDFMPLAADPRFTFYSLTVGEGADHIAFGGAQDLIYNCAPDLNKVGFAGTAALMLNLDVVVTVCTSSAHLAGVLGIPCFTLLAKDCYWVWGRDGDRTPWYPDNTRLFRQREAGEWQPVLEDVWGALGAMADAKLSLSEELLAVTRLLNEPDPEPMGADAPYTTQSAA